MSICLPQIGAMAAAAKLGNLPEEFYPGLFDPKTTIWKIYCADGKYKGVDLSFDDEMTSLEDIPKAVIKDIAAFLAVRLCLLRL